MKNAQEAVKRIRQQGKPFPQTMTWKSSGFTASSFPSGLRHFGKLTRVFGIVPGIEIPHTRTPAPQLLAAL